MKSIITNGKAVKYCIKNKVQYYKCVDTDTIFCEALNQSDMVGGTGEEERNAVHNPERLTRFNLLKPEGRWLDYGCGKGTLVKYLNDNNCNAVGFDPYSNEYSQVSGTFDLITMIEVVEHLTTPFNEFAEVYSMLNPNGILYIETSFSNWVDKEHGYINPNIGHSTIFSHKGLDMLLSKFGFKALQHINNNVRLYQK